MLLLFVLFVVVFTTFDYVTKLTAADGGQNYYYGSSVAIDGDIIVIGSEQYGYIQGVQTGTGAAYIYEKDYPSLNSWGLRRTITASDGASGDMFGTSVSISGNFIAVGADFADINGQFSAGAAYIFEKDFNGPNNWGQRKKLTSATPTGADYFGRSISIKGDYVIVSCEGDDESLSNSGAAFIFGRTYDGAQGGWGQVKKLKASTYIAANDRFGKSVAITNGYAIVGNPDSEIGNVGTNRGSALIFEQNLDGTDNWGIRKLLTVYESPLDEDKFGSKVAIDGDIAVVSEHGLLGRGAINIFGKDTGSVNNWGFQKIIVAYDAVNNELFGIGLAISGNIVLSGSPYDDVTFDNSGSVYSYIQEQPNTNKWNLINKINVGDPVMDGRFGYRVGISGNIAVMGAYWDDDRGSRSGSAYIYEYISPTTGTTSSSTGSSSTTGNGDNGIGGQSDSTSGADELVNIWLTFQI